jgi:hypothetical protein
MENGFPSHSHTTYWLVGCKVREKEGKHDLIYVFSKAGKFVAFDDYPATETTRFSQIKKSGQFSLLHHHTQKEDF